MGNVYSALLLLQYILIVLYGKERRENSAKYFFCVPRRKERHLGVE